MSQIQTSQTTVRESDIRQHIEDTPMFWVYRNGQQLQRSWNELSSLEKQHQLEASRREQFNAMFAPNSYE